MDGEAWSYKDSVSSSSEEVKRVLDHVYYGRMVQSVYHLLDADPESGRYGQSILSNTAQASQTRRFINSVINTIM